MVKGRRYAVDKSMDQNFFLIAMIGIVVIFAVILAVAWISAKRTKERNNAIEKNRAIIFSAQMEERRKELEAAKKMEENKEKLGVTDYVKRPAYRAEPENKPKMPEEEVVVPVSNRKLGDFLKK